MEVRSERGKGSVALARRKSNRPVCVDPSRTVSVRIPERDARLLEDIDRRGWCQSRVRRENERQRPSDVRRGKRGA